MARRYYKKDRKHYIVNGDAVMECGFMERFRDPHHEGRIAMLFVVQRPVNQSITNLILPGTAIAISFPEEHCNKDAYDWHEGEPFQTQLKIHLHKGAPPWSSKPIPKD